MKLENVIVGVIASVVTGVALGFLAIGGFIALWYGCLLVLEGPLVCDNEIWRQLGTLWLASAWLGTTIFAGVLAALGSNRRRRFVPVSR